MSLATRERDNLLTLWADEAQRFVTASEDGMSDYNCIDVIREARATVVAGENRCPVCGMRVDPSIAVALQVQGRTHYFCAACCKEIFEQNPGRF
jgi:YHS domain-containing protein